MRDLEKAGFVALPQERDVPVSTSAPETHQAWVCLAEYAVNEHVLMIPDEKKAVLGSYDNLIKVLPGRPGFLIR
jgi:hypothetical protein